MRTQSIRMIPRGAGHVFLAAAIWTVAACVLVSIVVHGVTSWPVERRLLGEDPRVD